MTPHRMYPHRTGTFMLMFMPGPRETTADVAARLARDLHRLDSYVRGRGGRRDAFLVVLEYDLLRAIRWAIPLADTLAQGDGETSTIDGAQHLAERLAAAGDHLRQTTVDGDHAAFAHRVTVRIEKAAAKARRPKEMLAGEQATGSSAVARRATGWAVRVLPVESRARYREEWAAELAELSARRAQLDYAAQVLFNAWALRRSLRERAASAARDR